MHCQQMAALPVLLALVAFFCSNSLALTAQEARERSQAQLDTRASGERLVDYFYAQIKQHLQEDMQTFCKAVPLGSMDRGPNVPFSALPLSPADLAIIHYNRGFQNEADRIQHEQQRRILYRDALAKVWPLAKARVEKDGYRVDRIYLVDERDGKAFYKDDRAPDGRILRQELVCSNGAVLTTDPETRRDQICLQQARVTLCWDAIPTPPAAQAIAAH